ncbi:MAG: DUF4864 domain-containing protein [Rhodobacterales bacterium CG2_30_65_12]|nr:MAG: DUF4864 domain-containing protein [Rhodobacterales bacterium CG2_30_65_12]
MKQTILIVAMLMAWAFPMKAEEVGDAPRTVIAAQLDAFRADDVTRAFSYASRGIQRVFVTPDGFGAMVREGYPMVWRPAETRFLELRELDGVTWQKLLVRDGAGVWHTLDYQMVREGGAWRIDGVQFLRRAEVGV